jgi:ryanodine receptor 2
VSYEPQPIDTSDVQLDEDILELTEWLAKNAHDTWARQRLAEGWSYGPVRDEIRKEHPGLLSYENLPESEKDYDRIIAMQTLKAILALGYRLKKVQGE